MAIDRDTVLHVARLARLDLRPDETDRLTEELGAILDAVSKVAELDLADVPPTSHPLDLVNVWADDEPRPSLSLERGIRKRDGARGRPVPRAADRRARGLGVIDTLRLTAEEALGLIESREVSTAELHAAYVEAAGERDGELHAYLRLVEESEGTGVPIALKDVISTKGVETTAGSRILEGYVPGLRRHGRGALQGRRDARDRQDEHGRVRDGLLDRELGLRAVAQPLGSDARARRLRRRHRGSRLGRSRALGSRLGHGRLDQAAIGPVRQRRPAADLRHRLAVRDRRVRLEPRPGRARREDRARRGAALLDHRGAGRERLDDGRAAGGGGVADASRRSTAVRIGIPKQVWDLPGHRARRPRIVRGGRRDGAWRSGPRSASATYRSRSTTGCRATT